MRVSVTLDLADYLAFEDPIATWTKVLGDVLGENDATLLDLGKVHGEPEVDWVVVCEIDGTTYVEGEYVDPDYAARVARLWTLEDQSPVEYRVLRRTKVSTLAEV